MLRRGPIAEPLRFMTGEGATSSLGMPEEKRSDQLKNTCLAEQRKAWGVKRNNDLARKKCGGITLTSSGIGVSNAHASRELPLGGGAAEAQGGLGKGHKNMNGKTEYTPVPVPNGYFHEEGVPKKLGSSDEQGHTIEYTRAWRYGTKTSYLS